MEHGYVQERATDGRTDGRSDRNRQTDRQTSKSAENREGQGTDRMTGRKNVKKKKEEVCDGMEVY